MPNSTIRFLANCGFLTFNKHFFSFVSVYIIFVLRYLCNFTGYKWTRFHFIAYPSRPRWAFPSGNV